MSPARREVLVMWGSDPEGVAEGYSAVAQGCLELDRDVFAAGWLSQDDAAVIAAVRDIEWLADA